MQMDLKGLLELYVVPILVVELVQSVSQRQQVQVELVRLEIIREMKRERERRISA